MEWIPVVWTQLLDPLVEQSAQISIMIVNGDSSIINKLETSLIDDARVVIYDRHMFIVLATA